MILSTYSLRASYTVDDESYAGEKFRGLLDFIIIIKYGST